METVYVKEFPSGVPPQFVNGLLRVLNGETKRLFVGNADIVKNTSRTTHDVVAQRLKQLPVRLLASTPKFEFLRFALRVTAERPRRVYSQDIEVTSEADGVDVSGVLAPGFPLLELRPGEEINLTASLEVDEQSRLTCGGTSMRICAKDTDPVYGELKTQFLEGFPKSERAQALVLWENTQSERAAQRAKEPYYELTVETQEGIVSAKRLYELAVQELQRRVAAWFAGVAPVADIEPNAYRIEPKEMPKNTTVTVLVSRVVNELGDTASYDLGHPLLPNDCLKIFLNRGKPLAEVLAEAQAKINGFFERS